MLANRDLHRRPAAAATAAGAWPRGLARGGVVGRRAVAVLGVLLVAGLLAGCGGSASTGQPAWRADPGAHLVASGASPRSQGEADRRARAAVAAQVRASLAARLRSEATTRWQDGQERTDGTVVQQLEQEVGFTRAELIRIDPDSRRFDDGQYHAVAYLAREDATRALASDYRRHAAEFARRAEVVRSTAPEDLPGFAAAWSEARQSWQALRRCARELQAVSGEAPADLDAQLARWDGLLAVRQERFAGLRVALDLGPSIPPRDRIDAAALRQTLVRSLTDLGLTVRGTGCGDAAYLVDLQPRLRYQGVVGVVCRLELTGAVRECATGDRWDLHLTHPRWVGEGATAHAARHQAAGAVTAATLTPRLAQALATSLPVR
jgi:hypothetical protein